LGDKRRNGFEISRDILKVCLKSRNKTRVVYHANLNSLRVNAYLEELVNMGLLSKENFDKRILYRTTVIGVRFLKNYSGKPLAFQDTEDYRRLIR